MKREEMRGQINEELKHIPRASFSQNMLRAYYNGMRMTDLSRNLACPAKETLIKAVLHKVVKYEMGDRYRRSTIYSRS